MTIIDLQQKINAAVFSDVKHGLSAFAYVRTQNGAEIKKLQMNDELRNSVTDILDSVLQNKVFCDDAALDSADNIADKRNILYEVCLSDEYNPFSCISEYKDIQSIYSELDQESLVGFLFRINTNDDSVIWAFQNVYPQRLIKRSKSLYAMLSGTTYIPLDRDVMKIESKVDFIILDNSLIALNISLLERSFGFDKFIRSEAQKTIGTISELSIISNVDKFNAVSTKLTHAKKLMKAKHSPVLEMDAKTLLRKLKKHPRYKDKFIFENNKILVNSQKDALEFIKMLNDDIVRSDLTNQEYDSPSKQRLAPL